MVWARPATTLIYAIGHSQADSGSICTLKLCTKGIEIPCIIFPSYTTFTLGAYMCIKSSSTLDVIINGPGQVCPSNKHFQVFHTLFHIPFHILLFTSHQRIN